MTTDPEYLYTTPSGQHITVFVEKYHGIVDGIHTVLCRPIGFNNCPQMTLDFYQLIRDDETKEFVCPVSKATDADLEQFRPRKGQFVYYFGERTGTVTRVEDALCYHQTLAGEHTLFIWKFTNSTADGLNNLHQWRG